MTAPVVAHDALGRLYQRGSQAQWDADRDLDWQADVDAERLAVAALEHDGHLGTLRRLAGVAGPPFSDWKTHEWTRLGMEISRWRLSQFLHGEHASLLASGRLVQTLPDASAKFHAAVQAADEARHETVFARYLETKLSGRYPVNPDLQSIFDDVVGAATWDVQCLGMQVVLEPLALATFRAMRDEAVEPLLDSALALVIADEGRHVAFGGIALAAVVPELTAAEVRERQEFVVDLAARLRDRLFMPEVWEAVGVDAARLRSLWLRFQRRAGVGLLPRLFVHVAAGCERIGLLDAGDGWLRRKAQEDGWVRR